MAKEAAKLSDRVILTSDNPRFEEPEDIINDMLAGLNATEKKKTVCITDRKEAIRTACLLAQAGDVILIAGKGHEDYQETKGVKRHFDDREIVKEIIHNSYFRRTCYTTFLIISITWMFREPGCFITFLFEPWWR
jgi:UDP-N-acetylmuramoyl-L-alanyl-D-glutamate--2,6-diaminopimelate ligase